MPLYEFRDKRNGALVEMRLPISKRDCVPAHLERVEVTPFGFVGRHLHAHYEADVAIPRALKQLEQTQSASSIAKETGFSVEKLKRVWNI